MEAASQEDRKKMKELPSGSVACPVAGLVLSLEVKLGDTVKPDDLVAVIEAMKMRTEVRCPHSGIVQEIWAGEGQMVGPEDTLMVVA
jgi:pyruvate carboxylase subunit B